jgi:hypothetical protein
MNTFEMYRHKDVQEAIQTHVKRIRGRENREDAVQEAYHAIADEGPINIEEAVKCVIKAIDRYRWHIRTEARNDAEGWVSNKARYENVGERNYNEWMDFAVHYLGIDNDEYDNSGIHDTIADERNYETADFMIRQGQFR